MPSLLAMGWATTRLGRHFWGYIALSCAAVSLVYFAFIALVPTASGISADFYATSAAILPVLLLALLVRIGRLANGLMRIRWSLRDAGKVEDELCSLAADIEQTLSELRSRGAEELVPESEEQLRRVKALQEKPDFNDATMKRLDSATTQVMFAALLVALAVASVGGGAALVALATDHSTASTLALTCLGLLWLLYTLSALEVVSFQNALAAGLLDAD